MSKWKMHNKIYLLGILSKENDCHVIYVKSVLKNVFHSEIIKGI